jgi:hypothetical protein
MNRCTYVDPSGRWQCRARPMKGHNVCVSHHAVTRRQRTAAQAEATWRSETAVPVAAIKRRRTAENSS